MAHDCQGRIGLHPGKTHRERAPGRRGTPFIHKKITVDGWDREDEEEVRSHPTSWRQLERLHQTFRTTLLMCTAALPQFGRLKVTKEELDDWYAWFYGEDIAGRKPLPSDNLAVRRAQCMAQDSQDGAPGHHSLRSPQEHQGRLPLLATGGP